MRYEILNSKDRQFSNKSQYFPCIIAFILLIFLNMQTEKENLIGMNIKEMDKFMQKIGEHGYRANQLFNWIYKKRITSFNQMTNFSKSLRSLLNNIAEIGLIKLVKINSTPNNHTKKFLFQLKDGFCLESVFMIEGKRRTACLSTQVGCALNCDFCATGKMGFKRNLSTGEIVDQLLFIQRHLDSDISNVVLMGMGEPFLNYDNVIAACEIFSHDKGIAIGKRKITISTAGIIHAIKRFADEGHKYKLAISLNAASDELRNQLMPINKKHPVREVINAAKYYSKQSRYGLTFEYVLIAGVNDSLKEVFKLQKLLLDYPCKINIIPYNETCKKYQRPTEHKINEFIQPFLKLNVVISVRRSKGENINAACGQLYYLSEQSLNASPCMPNS